MVSEQQQEYCPDCVGERSQAKSTKLSLPRIRDSQ